MHGLYDYRNEKYSNSTVLRLFFKSESFTNRKAYHNHFVIYIEDKKLNVQIVMNIQDYFNNDRFDVSKYDRYKVGLFYMIKDDLSAKDWDFIHNAPNTVSDANYAYTFLVGAEDAIRTSKTPYQF